MEDPGNDNGDEDGDEEDESNFGAQHVIALIDCHPDMFVPVPPRPKEDDNGKFDSEDEIGPSGKKEQSTPPLPPFDMSLRTIQSLVETLIETIVTRKTGKRDGVGILLYNTKPQVKKIKKDKDNPFEEKNDDIDDDDKMDENESDQEEEDSESTNSDSNENGEAANQTNVHKLLDLAPPGIKQFRELRKLVDQKERDAKEEFCPTDIPSDSELRQAPLQNAIEEAMRIFLSSKFVKDRNKAKKPDEVDSRAIWVFTNQTNPYTPALQQLVDNVASEAKEQNIEFIIWPLASMVGGALKSGTFSSPFFEALASAWYFDQAFQDMDELQQDGLDEIYRRMKKNRRLYHGPMHILHSSSNREAPIMIDWFSPVQLAKRPGKVQIDDETKL